VTDHDRPATFPEELLMPTRDSTTTGTPCWIDLFTSDPDASRAFYGNLFGWASEDAGEEYGGYINFVREGAPVAGAMRNDGSTGNPDAWNVYLAADDADAVATADNGGQVHVPPMAVGDLGKMAVIADAGGAAIGVWQPGQHRGFAVVDEPGAPGWFELHTRAFPQSVAFYEKVFGSQTQSMGDTPEFRYTVLTRGDDQIAGIMDASGFLPDGVPSHWSIYFRVADTDAAITKAVELGATVVQPAEDTPYGRLASLTDPTGALFKLLG
jgi:predicted enzyme related to lactoylglutathione lyase